MRTRVCVGSPRKARDTWSVPPSSLKPPSRVSLTQVVMPAPLHPSVDPDAASNTEMYRDVNKMGQREGEGVKEGVGEGEGLTVPLGEVLVELEVVGVVDTWGHTRQQERQGQG
jgi:hypothetical protein